MPSPGKGRYGAAKAMSRCCRRQLNRTPITVVGLIVFPAVAVQSWLAGPFGYLWWTLSLPRVIERGLSHSQAR